MFLMNPPAPLTSRRFDVYLAGGITGCPTWQRDVSTALETTNLTVACPRGDLPPTMTDADALAHIEWKKDALLRSRTIVFWFPAETLAPTALLELGGALERARCGKINLVIGTDPSHHRRVDIEQYAAAHGHTGAIETTLDAVIARVTSTSEHRRRLVFSPTALID